MRNYHTSSLAAISLFVLSHLDLVQGQNPPAKVCTDGECSNCPSGVTQGGNGYPSCVVYNSKDVFSSGSFKAAPGGGYSVYFDIAEPDSGCSTIIKSPANTDVVGCGTTIGAYKHATCSELSVDDTFMVQYCCGTGDCTSAGSGGKRSIRGLQDRSTPGLTGLKFTAPNGSVIQPVQIGEPPSKPSKRVSDLHNRTADLVKRESCSKWTADSGQDQYTRPSDNETIVAEGVDGGQGGASVQITHERSQSWTTSISAGISFDVFSANMDFSMTQEVSTSKTYNFQIPAGESGNVGWTATLTCSTGTIECNDGSYHGEVCSPTSDDGEPAGTYRVIATS